MRKQKRMVCSAVTVSFQYLIMREDYQNLFNTKKITGRDINERLSKLTAVNNFLKNFPMLVGIKIYGCRKQVHYMLRKGRRQILGCGRKKVKGF